MSLPDEYQMARVEIDPAREVGIECHGDGDMSIYTARGNLYLPADATDALIEALGQIETDTDEGTNVVDVS